MADIAIRAENLSKRYRTGELVGYGNLRESLMTTLSAPFRHLRSRGNGRSREPHRELSNSVSLSHDAGHPSGLSAQRDYIWALKDASFEVKHGEAVGIIGFNGAGKSTLLKVLTRITEPTEGYAEIHGRVGSLLEVGTGFHPELTGRENVYLNGAVLGMKRKEIDRNFDEIVDFSGVERFIDTPLKRYSSGMQVRLAFAVAAHLELEILLVDEVLAVGDYKFQQKCLGKMEDVTGQGRTVLFVSHNMGAVSSLCGRCILLEGGRVAQIGKTSDVIVNYYTNGTSSGAHVDFSKGNIRIGDEYAALISGSIKNSTDQMTAEVDINEPLTVCMRFEILKESSARFVPQFPFFTADGTCAFTAYHQDAVTLLPGEYEVECRIPASFFNDGAYFVALGLAVHDDLGIRLSFYRESALCFNVRDPIEGTPGRNGYGGPMLGLLRPQFAWTINSKAGKA